MSSSHTKNPSRVASGLKASIHNPNVSDDAKNRARERLAELGEDTGEVQQSQSNPVLIEEEEEFDEFVVSEGGGASDETEHRVLGGYKATMHNPRVSQQAKDHARQVLEENDAL